jgi:glutamate synthase (NADPH/NADH) small chain
VHQLELLPRPPETRGVDNPWPQWPQIFRVTSAHEEGGDRLYSVSTTNFVGDDQGRVRALRATKVEPATENGRPTFKPVAGTEFDLPADLVLLAMGFVGAERGALLSDLGVEMTPRGTVKRDATWMTNVPGVFVAGDMQRGQSLIVWAIAEGRSAARGVDAYLTGRSDLPAPVQ